MPPPRTITPTNPAAVGSGGRAGAGMSGARESKGRTPAGSSGGGEPVSAKRIASAAHASPRVTATEDGLVAGHMEPDPDSTQRPRTTERDVRAEIETDLLTDLMEESP